MLVYRLCQEKEINEIMDNKSFDNVGRHYTVNNRVNTHNYRDDKKYLHFFKDRDSIFYCSTSSGNYICTYDIPNDVLLEGKGIGHFLDRISFKHLQDAEEYAIITDNLSFDYLEKVELIKESMDVEDLLFNEMDDKLETIYEKEKSKSLKKQL